MNESNKENPPGYTTCAASLCRAEAEAEVKGLPWFDLYMRWRTHFSVGCTSLFIPDNHPMPSLMCQKHDRILLFCMSFV